MNETYIYKSLPHWKQNKYKVWWLHPYADVTDYDNQDSHYSFYLSNTEGNWKTKIHVSSIFYTESLAGRRRVLCILPSVIWASCDTGKYIFMIVDNSFLMIPLWQGTSFFYAIQRAFISLLVIMKCIIFKTAPVSYSLHNWKL